MDLIFAMAPQGGDAGGGSMISTLVMFGAIFAIFYFMIIRPQQKKAKEREAMLGELKKGDKVVTSGGLHGIVSGLDEKTCLIDVGGNVKMKFDRTAIANIVKPKES
ncbi:MAG: preprotein translocase subunit YajC [Melioribacteraceae bacterium]|nr:preprotein translocase subunit YajC [Melioribacteraceae bacterium]MCF8265976.1 preprotein translocase subunit YajC [Melioribacteraceae bacterium]MCF8412546.1 preprotein translocase subunit YajC [Melioribacteraceae bacterium]MCF8432498.1 preprotein translocase subunit YajC [Melioribacteraceae bacterium]